METLQLIEELSRKYAVPVDAFLRTGVELALQERKKSHLRERLEILSRYGAESNDDLENKIRQGIISDHPAWEDLIEIKNIETEVREIDRDLGLIRAA